MIPLDLPDEDEVQDGQEPRKTKRGWNRVYHTRQEMRLLSDKLIELVNLYKADDPKTALAACRELRMLAALGYEVESGGQIGAATGQALLSIAHQRKIEGAIAQRKRPKLPVEVAFTPMKETGNGTDD